MLAQMANPSPAPPCERFRGGLRTHESFEDARQDVGRDAGPGVFDFNEHVAVGVPATDAYGAVGLCITRAVLQQIGEQLLQPAFVTVDHDCMNRSVFPR